jgi:putative peptide zinc metalloprotease protein
LHELAHGLTCKHFGGDVHESGVLVMFFMPCLYCNVSDAWMIREKWKRMLIAAAGGYFDLCLWALAVFAWRLTVQDSLPNFVAFVVLTVCGTRGLINFNPLLRLDGYYLLSDWLGIANLRKRAREYWMGHVRWLLWGAERPAPQAHGRVLLSYGLMMWVFAIWALDLIVLRMVKFAGDTFGVIGLAMGVLLLLYAIRRVFSGLFRSEFMNMLKQRPGRAARWGIGLATAAAVSFVIPVRHYATGDFEVRPGMTHQVQAPVTAFVRNVFVEEGAAVAKGDPLVALESPDLVNQIAVKRAELRESEANLTRLRAGARPEEIADQRERVSRLQAWHRLGQEELDRARRRLEHELIALDQRVEQSQAELELLQNSLQQSEQLYRLGALAGAELRNEKTQLAVLRSQLRQAEADRSAREAEGVRQAEAELSQRMQQLADAEARLQLLLAGTRPEEISAEEARRQRLDEELTHLLAQQEKLVVRAPAAGLVAMHRIRELIGSLAPQGTPLCTIEDASHSFIEISVREEDVVGLAPGLPVTLKARAIPFETFYATLERIAPSTSRSTPPVATTVASQPTLVCYCQLDNADGRLRTGMSGFGRVSRGWKTLGLTCASKSLKYLRTEFWW